MASVFIARDVFRYHICRVSPCGRGHPLALVVNWPHEPLRNLRRVRHAYDYRPMAIHHKRLPPTLNDPLLSGKSMIKLQLGRSYLWLFAIFAVLFLATFAGP